MNSKLPLKDKTFGIWKTTWSLIVLQPGSRKFVSKETVPEIHRDKSDELNKAVTQQSNKTSYLFK